MNNRRQKLAEIKQAPVANDNCPTTTPPPSAPSARLLKGECVATMSAMASESVDLIVTSPPYMNIGMPYGDDFQSIEDCPSSKHLAQVWRGVNGERASSGVGF